ncbi:MAG: GNAT family N-acetyltransferase [Chloroflexi bacterium]|nr:GNAT family N-acetyltransferase [Chloroflexota bacterium]
MIKSQQDIRDTVAAMLAAELSCSPADLTDGRVHITVRDPNAHENPAHRLFPPHPGRIGIASLGTGGIVCVDGPHLAWAEEVFGAMTTRDEIFMPQPVGRMADIIKPAGLTLFGPFPRFAVSRNSLVHIEPPGGYVVKVVDQAGADSIKERDKWVYSIALDPAATARPTVIAAIAEHKGEVVGVCGASADSPYMWQLGIDVTPDHQGRGIAPALTSAVAKAVLEAGKLPYYGATNSNVPSMRTALAAGFKPTWVEVLSRPSS